MTGYENHTSYNSLPGREMYSYVQSELAIQPVSGDIPCFSLSVGTGEAEPKGSISLVGPWRPGDSPCFFSVIQKFVGLPKEPQI